ncbi:MAG: SDR family oxidoreductase [Anaerolineae bacterium]|jgi:NAD(P)-dependent dehydrogenase (short-subunit alcohol dehydrogenase family)|nr:SDR family oxidoreductase [Anaerolineae bacterium]
MFIDLNDQVALVTGSAHRVGKAIALELAKRGVHLIVNYHSTPEDVVRNTLHEIKSHGVDAYPIRADVSTPLGVAEVFSAVREHFGRLNILVNSASVFPNGTLEVTSYEDWQQTLQVNLTGPFLCTQAAIPLMRQNDPKGGAIVNICDRGSITPWPERAAHGISKAGLWMLTQTSAINFAPDIRVNAVLPGPVLAPPDMSDDRWQQIGRDQTLLQRVGSAEDVARAVTYLVSESYITGTMITVNGGEHLR